MTRQHLNESVAVDSRLSPPHKIWRHTLTMKLHQLRALVAIADTGSIRNAARATDLSPAAITKAIRELEEDLNVTLIIREATGVTLTEAGRAIGACTAGNGALIWKEGRHAVDCSSVVGRSNVARRGCRPVPDAYARGKDRILRRIGNRVDTQIA
jgi:DNA-binding MarR family transcriptional regulator